MDAVMLDCRLMTAKKEAHEYIAQKLGFPDYYGKNLDALYDCLTEFCRKKLIVLRFTSALGDNLGKYGDSLLSVFTDADGEGKINLVITEK